MNTQTQEAQPQKAQNTILHGHNSFETAYCIESYPFGRLRTKMYVWIETKPKLGDRVIRQTIDPKTGRLCAPKASTYLNIYFLYKAENGHIHSTGIGHYQKKEEIEKFISAIGGVEKLNTDQLKQYKQLLGINEKVVDEFTGKAKKDFSVKWERKTIGQGWKDGVWNKGEPGRYNEVKITFDRPDGVKLIEIFNAMKSLNQDKLNQVYEWTHSEHWGNYQGVVRICCRGGVYLGEIKESSYKNWLASDANVIQEEMEVAA